MLQVPTVEAAEHQSIFISQLKGRAGFYNVDVHGRWSEPPQLPWAAQPRLACSVAARNSVRGTAGLQSFSTLASYRTLSLMCGPIFFGGCNLNTSSIFFSGSVKIGYLRFHSKRPALFNKSRAKHCSLAWVTKNYIRIVTELVTSWIGILRDGGSS